MCIIFPLDTKTHLPFRKFSTSSEVPQNPMFTSTLFPVSLVRSVEETAWEQCCVYMTPYKSLVQIHNSPTEVEKSFSHSQGTRNSQLATPQTPLKIKYRRCAARIRRMKFEMFSDQIILLTSVWLSDI